MSSSTLDFVCDTTEDNMNERCRFRSIVRRYVESRDVASRRRLRAVLLDYLGPSPASDDLIGDLISQCVEHRGEGRLDAAIDVLSQLEGDILRYAQESQRHEIYHWAHLYPGRPYKPNDDYWYILLRAVGQSNANASDRVRCILLWCKDAANSRPFLEAVLESLGDVGTEEAFDAVNRFIAHPDPFVAKLATGLIVNR